MKTFVADIFPTLQRFSEKLDNLTILTNQHWVSLDDILTNKRVYIFRANNELIISENGKVEKAKWEYLEKNYILIDLPAHSYLFIYEFIDNNVLVLRMDNVKEYAVFVNEKKFGDLNSIDKVISFLEQQYLTRIIKTPEQLDQEKKQIKMRGYNRDLLKTMKWLLLAALIISSIIIGYMI